LIRDEMQLFLEKSPTAFVDSAFSPEVVAKYKNDSARWWTIYSKPPVANLAKLAIHRTQRCKSSSSSAERNFSIWSLLLTKLRNRLSIAKATAFVSAQGKP
jgi:hypothetical protein